MYNISLRNNYTNNLNFKGKETGIIKKTIPLVKSVSDKTAPIFGQDNCWRLYKPEVFEQFIMADKELHEPISDIIEIGHRYGLTTSIDMLRPWKTRKPEVAQFYKTVKDKYNIDLDVPPKVYRFVGESEILALVNDGIVHPQRGYTNKFDVTINPDLNWNTYRIEFKPTKKFSVLDRNSRMSENLGTDHDYFYHYDGSYTADDVANIERYRP